VFSKDWRLNLLFSIVFLTLSACGGLGTGCGCSQQPLPAGGLPKDQTIEGGGQIRVTQAGFQKLTQVVPAILQDALGEGFCIGQQSILGANLCYQNQGSCAPGCRANITVTQTRLQVTNAQTLNIRLVASLAASVPVDPPWPFSDCTLTISANDLMADLDIGFGINATNGELTLRLNRINDYDLNLNFNGCSVISFLGNLVADLADSFLGEFIVDLLTPTINDLIQGFLPSPLGIEGMVDVGQLLAGVSPGTEGFMEARMVPGGYVSLANSGMSLGLITGLNSDQDPTTRTAQLDSEPAYCVPPIPAPNFAAPPASLTTNARGTFNLVPAEEFLGMPEPADDLAIGLSETTLDLAGHHLVTSGGLCLGVGTGLVDQLKLGTIGLLVPSLGELGKGDEPLLLVTRPQKAIDFSIGEGTEASPAITLHIKEFEVDFYGFIFERYTRAFSMSLDLDVGVNLEFVQQPGMPAQVKPILVGLSSSNIDLTVLNNEFVRETRQQLEAVLPTVFDLALPLLGDGIGPIDVPSFAGFTLNNLRVQKVVTSQDEFMAIYASLGASQLMRQQAQDLYPSLGPVISQLDDNAGVTAWPARVEGVAATLRSVVVPSPDSVRASLFGAPGQTLPTVTLDVASHDALGRELEWSWNLSGGLWRPYRPGGELVLADRAFAWQGKYTIGLHARVRGDYRTTTVEPIEVPVVIDSAGPKIRVDEAQWTNRGFLVPATDAVYEDGLEWAYGKIGDDEPTTAWSTSAAVAKDVVRGLEVNGEVLVFVRDPSGNVSIDVARSNFHGAPGESGCSCNSNGRPDGGSIVLVLLVGAYLLFRRRAAAAVSAVARDHSRLPSLRSGGRIVPMLAIWVGLSVTLSMVPGCSCGSTAGHACELTEDCADLDCPDGQISICFEGECLCTDDVPYGKIGPMSDVAVAPNADVIVSAYAHNHGDLVVARMPGAGRVPDEAWEFVDGVPAGPVALPDSKVRGGILDPGPDVGLYTSVAIGAADVAMVAYHDKDTGSLKFASKPNGGTWSNHVVDAGTGTVMPEIGGEQAGLYNALSLRGDDGRPGIAYLAQVSQGDGLVVAEVRYAEAMTATPSSSADWTITVIDMVALPPIDPNNPDVYPIPAGIGLFVEIARDSANNPAIVYYDRANGDLKLARYNAANSRFDVTVAAGQNRDDGWYPSIAFDAQDVAHVAFQGADHDDVFYINTMTNQRELVDDGYRIVGTTPEGLPKPEFHFVGSDTQIVMTPTGPYVIYQDSTSHELLVATKDGTAWMPTALAGNEQDFAGAYGFYASATLGGNEVVVSNWVLHQQLQDNWVEIFRLPTAASRTLD